METFMLAAVLLIVAVSLFIKRSEALHRAFAVLCLIIFFHKGGVFFFRIFPGDFWKNIEYLSLIAIPPVLIQFARLLLHQQSFLSKRDVTATALFGVLAAISLFSPLSGWRYLGLLLYTYIGIVLAVCYAALLDYIKKKGTGVERRRMIYLAVACGATALFSNLDILSYYGYAFPTISDFFMAALLYFVLIVMTYPQLPELHELMARTLVVFIVTLFGAIIFALVAGLFGKDPVPPFTHILLASLVIVISIEPFKLILKKLFGYIYPEGKDVFTSFYALDEKLEREKSQLLEEMAPVLAHEIRNPLGSIKGAAQYLRSEAAAGEERKLLDVIIEEVDRLNAVVSQFLNYAKPFSPNLKEHDINQIIEKTIAVIRANNVSENIVIEKELRPDLPPVYVDAEQLLQVFLNIAINAIESMSAGGTLTFRTSKIEGDTDEAVGISIRDTGQGMSKEEIKNIFKPFFTTKERGVGLGLAICRRIVKNHGGNIRVKSIPEQGTIFYIRLGVNH